MMHALHAVPHCSARKRDDLLTAFVYLLNLFFPCYKNFLARRYFRAGCTRWGSREEVRSDIKFGMRDNFKCLCGLHSVGRLWLLLIGTGCFRMRLKLSDYWILGNYLFSVASYRCDSWEQACGQIDEWTDGRTQRGHNAFFICISFFKDP